MQAAVEKLHQQLSLVGQPHNFLIKQLAAAEATAAAAQSELAAAKVCGRHVKHASFGGCWLEAADTSNGHVVGSIALLSS